MFDTGADGLLHLFYNDYEALKEMKSTHSLEKAFGINALGIGGLNMDNAKESSRYVLTRLISWEKSSRILKVLLLGAEVLLWG